jgi:tetratricopeptide (TPR) repeat protein
MLRSVSLVGVCCLCVFATAACDKRPVNENVLESLHAEAENQLYGEQKFVDALRLYDQIIDIAPDDPWAHMGRGDALVSMRQFDEAIQSYNRAIDLDSELVEAYSGRGWAFEWKQQWDRSIEDYRRALSVDAEYLDAMCGLSWVLATCPRDELRNGDQAVQLARNACRLAADDAIALDTLGAAYAEKGDFQQAITCAKSALAMVHANEEEYGADCITRIEARIDEYQRGVPHRDTGEDASQ